MKSRLVLLACCLTLLSSCGQGDKGTGKTPEFAVIEAKTTTANLTNSSPATIKGKQDVPRGLSYLTGTWKPASH